ncbi:osteopetrosis-associated transmembrane protein 1-like [Homalodisca vitripennis]|uniref:osteopetrosis-associated transmembrane protein 1-like n=1 Tax=Homalodisca vitripennis TaxID=197043 RepID=UPI001EEC1161|nr:osteopetrosis-associated transmembrane protein 1-like [Homalodisca vitripennis]
MEGSANPDTRMTKDDNHCEELLESFALVSANYTFCAIRFARPIRLCQFCVEKYLSVESVHSDILTLEDEEGEQCKAKLLNLDRLQVVEAGFNYVTGLWQRASCNKCFETDSQGNPTKELNEKTKKILQLSNDTQTCIEEHHNDTYPAFYDPEVCTVCKKYYVELNSFYDSQKEDGFCMDIVDMMNTTRSQWSTGLRCCVDRKQPEWVFLVSTAVFTCLPLVFYLAAYMFVTSKEQTVLRQSRLQEHINSATSSNMMCPD